MREIERVSGEVVSRGKFPFILGGEHSITPAVVKAVARHHRGLSVLQIDAHADLRESFMGTPHNHACAMRRTLDCAPTTQVGVRSLSAEEAAALRSLKTTIFYDFNMRQDEHWIERVVDSLSETQRIYYYDPTPGSIRDGRPHLYNTHFTSGLGHTSCASCHVDARMDRLAWDLGDPAGAMKAEAEQNDFAGVPGLAGGFPDWHPMKGPMLTQTLQDIIGKEPLHWRGDRDGIEEFNQTFTSLQGRPDLLTAEEIQKGLETFHGIKRRMEVRGVERGVSEPKAKHGRVHECCGRELERASFTTKCEPSLASVQTTSTSCIQANRPTRAPPFFTRFASRGSPSPYVKPARSSSFPRRRAKRSSEPVDAFPKNAYCIGLGSCTTGSASSE